MKKILFILIILVMFIPLKVNGIGAEAYIVLDSDSNRVLDGKNINKEKLIASTTKIMTCLVTIENVSLDDIVMVNDSVLKAYGSAIYIEVGEEMTIRDLLYGLMLRSGNDAAIVIQDYFNSKNMNLIKLMNDKAKRLGMNNTIFYNPHGLEEDSGIGNTSTAYDMAKLMSYAIKNDEFQKIVSTKNYKTKTNYKSYTWKNKNKLLSTYEFCNGGKTGYTKKALRTLVTSASKDNKNIVVVTLNDGNDFLDHKKLYEDNFNKYDLLNVIDKNNFKIRNESYYRGVSFYVNNSFNMLVTKDEASKIFLNIILDKNDDYKDNDKIGKVQVMFNNENIFEENIYIIRKSSTKKDSLWKKIKNYF